MGRSRRVAFAVVLLAASPATAHHEALFGPQSSLAVESEGFVSFQTHSHAYGINGTETDETTFILSGGLSPIRDVPWSVVLVRAYTYQTTRMPVPGPGPFSACDGCLRRENMLVSTSWRFDLKSLQERWGKDGNFALVSAALEPPTGDKDYPAFQGPFKYIAAGMFAFERGPFATVVLGYYRGNTLDSTSSKKGDNFLVGAGFAYTPIDRPNRLLSFQLGAGYEYHFSDVDHGSDIGGGGELLVSPTIVGSPMKNMRIFALVSLPVAQNYSADYQHDRWRVGVGVIYSFDRSKRVVAPSLAGGTGNESTAIR